MRTADGSRSFLFLRIFYSPSINSPKREIHFEEIQQLYTCKHDINSQTVHSGKNKFSIFFQSVGSDQTLPDWILNERFHVLQSIIEFYHKSFDTILASCNSEYELFSKKLCDIFEVYSPLIEYFVSTFGNVPTIKFPRVSIKSKLPNKVIH